MKRFIGQKVKSISVLRNTDTARVTAGLGPSYCEKWIVSEKRQYSNRAVTHTVGEQITNVNYDAIFPSQLESRIFRRIIRKITFLK